MFESKKQIVGLIIIAILFLGCSYLANEYSEQIREIIRQRNVLGMVFYVLAGVIAVVAAPVSALPLLPFAAVTWGNFYAAVLSVVSWAAGAAIAFILARKFQPFLLGKFSNLDKIAGIIKKIAPKNLFWSVVFLRMVLPVDALSYGLGFFSDIKFKPYLAATIIGIIPFAFIFSYSVKLPIIYKVLVLVLALVIVFYGLKKYFKP